MTTEAEASQPPGGKKQATRARIVEARHRTVQAERLSGHLHRRHRRPADVAPRTFYSYFDAKVDVAMVQLDTWIEGLDEALDARPDPETLDEMDAGALAARRPGHTSPVAPA